MPGVSELSVRDAVGADADALLRLWRSLAAEGTRADPRYRLGHDADDVMRRIITDDWLGAGRQRLVLLAVSDGDPVGFIAGPQSDVHPVLEAPDTIVITDAYVAPDHRRRGVGRQLVGAVVERAGALDAEVLEVGTLTLDRRAVAFWTSQGFGD